MDFFNSGLLAAEVIETNNRQYNVMPINSASELKPGDHIRINYWTLDHHLLVVRVLSDTRVLVLNYTGPLFSLQWPPTLPVLGEVIEEVREIDPQSTSCKYPVSVLKFRHPPETLYTADEAFDRVKRRLGERRWELLTNNCEHLVTWALTGTPRSSQIDALKDVGKYSVNTALKFGVILVPLFGVLLGLSLAIAAGLVKAAVLYTKFRHNVNETEQALRKEARFTHHSALENTCPRIPVVTIPRTKRSLKAHYDVPQDHLSLQSDSNVHTTHLSKAAMRSAHNYCSALQSSSKLMSRQLAHISAWLDITISAKFLDRAKSNNTLSNISRLRCGPHQTSMSRDIFRSPFAPPDHIHTNLQYNVRKIP